MKLLEGAGSWAVLDLGHLALNLEGVFASSTPIRICVMVTGEKKKKKKHPKKPPKFTEVVLMCVEGRGGGESASHKIQAPPTVFCS